MQKIRPFKAAMYNPKSVSGAALRPEKFVCPPYDVISAKAQDELYRKSPYNFVRLVLGKTGKSDGTGDNRYTRAAADLRSWLKKKILVEEPEEAFYIYSQNYKVGGKTVTQTGFIALMDIDATKVLPHENTLAKPKEDRLSLMRATRANLEPIFVLYDDPRHAVADILRKYSSGARPVFSFTLDGIKHELRRLDDKKTVKRISELMEPKDIFIADGHHRYEVSRMYLEEASASGSPAQGARYIMAYFVESDERMLTVLAAHRVIRDTGRLRLPEIEARLSKHFKIEREKSLSGLMSALKVKSPHAFGMYAGGKFYLLKLTNPAAAESVMSGRSRPWRELDVSILHFFIMRHILGIRDEDDNVEYVKDAKEAAGLVEEGGYKIAFFLNPTRVSQVKDVALAGERMPKKATYFYPKPLSGLVINRH